MRHRIEHDGTTIGFPAGLFRHRVRPPLPPDEAAPRRRHRPHRGRAPWPSRPPPPRGCPPTRSSASRREHTFFSWSVQGAIDPIAIDRAEGVYLYTPEGQRILDFNSQLMSVNIGHGDRRVIDAITAQAHEAPVRPARVRDGDRGPASGRSSPRSCPATSTRCSSRSAAPRRSRTRSSSPAHYTGRHKVLARYRAYHGATFGAMTLTGDPRRWANEPGLVGVVRYPDTHRWGEAEPRPPPSRSRVSRTSSATRAPTRSRRSSSRRSSARTASSSRPTATSRASASSATGTGS